MNLASYQLLHPAKRPVGVEPTLPPWQGSRLPLHHGRKIASQPNCQRSRIHEASKEHRVGIEPTSPRYDGGILPLDDQCLLLFSGTGENRTHIVRFKRPMHYLVCHNLKLFCCFVASRRGRNRTFNPRLIRTPLLPLSHAP